MKTVTRIALILFAICFISVCTAEGTIRVVAYNTENNPDNATEDALFSTIFSAIGNESVNGLAKQLDILIVSETDTSSSGRLANILNTLYNGSTYIAIASSSVGGDRTGVVYDSNTVTLLGTSDLTTIGTHPILRAHFRPVVSTAPGSEFYVYAVHLKSGASLSDRAERAVEVTNLRNNANALDPTMPIIFAGDFNMQGSSEGAWTNMLASGNAQAVDVANSPGAWRDNPAFISLHSQDPGTAMDDRFDFQFATGELLDGTGLDYIPNSFHVFGNNGTHTLNAAISTGTGASTTVLAALMSASDHLPIVADYDTNAGDTNPPVFTYYPESVRFKVQDSSGLSLSSAAWVSFVTSISTTVTDDLDQDVQLLHDAPDPLPVGGLGTLVTFTATDDSDNSSMFSVRVRVYAN